MRTADIPVTGPPSSLLIDCDTCVSQHTPVCEDCVVTFVCDREPSGGVVVDVAEFRALRRLGDGGLVPQLRHVRRIG